MKEIWSNFTSTEKELFQKVCRRLLKTTFIVRDKDDRNKKAYYFASKNIDTISEYFAYIGFDIFIDRDNGVVMLQNYVDKEESGGVQSNRFGLKKIESIILCCLWTLYSDKVASGSLVKTISISIMDLRYELEKYDLKDGDDNKKQIENALNTLSKFNLLDVVGKIGEPDCRIRLYPSLQFALNVEYFKQFVQKATKRMQGKNKDYEEETNNEQYEE